MLPRLADAAPELRVTALAVFHGVILYGVFDRSPLALSLAAYFRDWVIAEIIALLVTPYLMMLTVRKHERALWERALWLPASLLVLGGIGGAVRILRATWFYVLTCVPVIWVRHTRGDADRGCARALVSLVVLVFLLGVFANRRQWPIGTVVRKGMAPDLAELANSMAFATVYFAAAAGVDLLIRRVMRDYQPE